MKRARGGQTRRALPRLGPCRLGALDGRGRTGDDDLPRAVEVRGHQHLALGALLAERGHAVLVGLQQRAHDAGVRRGGLGHKLGARFHQRERRLVAQHARHGQRAHLPQREAQHRRRLHAARHERAGDAHRQHAQRRLGVARVVELVGIGVEHEIGHVVPQHVRRAGKRFLHLFHSEKIATHARLLRPLPREHEDGRAREEGRQRPVAQTVLASLRNSLGGRRRPSSLHTHRLPKPFFLIHQEPP